MKKILLFVLVGFVFANPSYASEDIPNTYEIKYEAGWNLVTNYIDPLRDKVSRVYIMDPKSKEYYGGVFSLFTNPDSSLKAKFEEMYTIYGTPGNDNGMQISTSMWMYITEDVSIPLSQKAVDDLKKKTTPSSIKDAKKYPFTLYKGWNLVPIHPFLVFEESIFQSIDEGEISVS